MRAAFAQPGFTRLFAGTTTSMFGDSVMLLVFSIWVKDLTGSNGLAGLTFLFMVVPSLFAAFLGGPIDRVRRKPLLVWANLASVVMLVPLAFVRGASDVWLIWIVAFCYGISFIVVPAGLNGLLKEMLPEDLLVEANSGLQTIKEAFRLVGPLIGAALYAGIGGWAVAAVDAVSFLLAAILIASIRLREVLPQREEQHWWAEMTAGVRHLVDDDVLRPVMASLCLLLLVLGFSEASIYAVTDAFDKPVEYVGVLVSVQGVGAVVGGLLSGRIVRRVGEPGAMVVSLLAMVVAFVLVVVAGSLPVLFAGIVALGFSLPLLMVALMTLIQTRTPQRLMGRVSTAVEVVLGAPQAISLAIGALLVALIDYRIIFAIMAAVSLLAAGYLALRTHPLRGRGEGLVRLVEVEDGAVEIHRATTTGGARPRRPA